jgi:phage terminase large subunit-like protein
MTQREDDILLSRMRVLEEEARARRYNQLAEFVPFAPQAEFIKHTADKREIAFIASNQSGKSHCGAIMTAAFLTGIYPKGWNGRRFDRPVRMWACGVSALAVRDILQKKLFGQPGTEPGSGLIPKDRIIGKPTASHGVSEAFDTARIRHLSGGISTLTFKSYEQGMMKFTGEGVDAIHLDEICPAEVYGECLARVSLAQGLIFCTFTPLGGWTPLTMRYLQEPSPHRAVVTTNLYDCGLYTKEQANLIVEQYPVHERAARAYGQPSLFDGAVFAGVTEDMIREPTLERVPPEWMKIWGLDFGIGHAFGAALLAWDREADVIHLLHCIKVKDQLPYQHANLMRPIGGNVAVAWPHDGNVRGRDGQPLSKLYKSHGLRMLETHATHPDGSISTEAGVLELHERMRTGRFKVAEHCKDWFAELRGYARKDNQIVKINDDLMSATRIGVMARRFARAVDLGPKVIDRRGGPSNMAGGMDYDVFDYENDRPANPRVPMAKGMDYDIFNP